jgi:hypothetical protein
MEQKTPARGHAFWRFRRTDEQQHPAEDDASRSRRIEKAREIAARVAAILPAEFEGVLPRGYTLLGNCLVLARFEMEGTRGTALYARHTHWGERETAVFMRDLQEGWLTELSAYMRWQLRGNPVENAVFQHAMVHLNQDVMEQTNTQP